MLPTRAYAAHAMFSRARYMSMSMITITPRTPPCCCSMLYDADADAFDADYLRHYACVAPTRV